MRQISFMQLLPLAPDAGVMTWVILLGLRAACCNSGGWSWYVRLWDDQGVFPCTGQLYSRLRLHPDVDERRPRRQLRNVGVCFVKQLLGLVRIISRPENGRNSIFYSYVRYCGVVINIDVLTATVGFSVHPYYYVARRCNAGRSLRRKRRFSSRSRGLCNLLQWAVGSQQQQRRCKLFVLKAGIAA